MIDYQPKLKVGTILQQEIATPLSDNKFRYTYWRIIDIRPGKYTIAQYAMVKCTPTGKLFKTTFQPGAEAIDHHTAHKTNGWSIHGHVQPGSVPKVNVDSTGRKKRRIQMLIQKIANFAAELEQLHKEVYGD